MVPLFTCSSFILRSVCTLEGNSHLRICFHRLWAKYESPHPASFVPCQLGGILCKSPIFFHRKLLTLPYPRRNLLSQRSSLNEVGLCERNATDALTYMSKIRVFQWNCRSEMYKEWKPKNSA